MLGLRHRHSDLPTGLADNLHFLRGVSGENVDRDDHRQTEFLQVLDMFHQVAQPRSERRHVRLCQFGGFDATVKFQGFDRGNQDRSVGSQAGLAALDIDELLRSEVRAKTGLRHGVLRETQPQFGGRYRVAAMGDISKWPTVDHGRVAFEGLHQVRLHAVAQQHRHRSIGFQVAGRYQPAILRVSHDDLAQALFEFGERLGETKCRHHFGGRGDVEARLAGNRIARASEADHNLAQSAFVHVDHPPPDDAALVNAQCVAEMQMVVQHGGQQVMSGGNHVKIAIEVQVDLLHGRHLRVAAARAAAFNAEAGTYRRLAQTHHRPFTQPAQRIRQSNAGGRLALARGRGVDRRHQNQLSGRRILKPAIQIQRDFGFGFAKVLKVVLLDTQLGGNGLNRLQLRFPGDLNRAQRSGIHAYGVFSCCWRGL